jgi:hypothetical protein
MVNFIFHIVISSQVIFTKEVYYTKLNTQLLNTVHNTSRILTLVWEILELQQLRVMPSGFWTSTPNTTTNYNS